MSSLFLKLYQILCRNSFAQNVRILFYFIDSVILALCPIKKNASRNTVRKKVLIIYNIALGDGVMFYGVSQCIREIWPRDEYEVSLACQTAFARLHESSGVYDKILAFDFAGSSVDLKKRMELLKALRAEEYDIVIDPVGCEDCTTNVFMTRAARGKRKIGVMDITLRPRQTAAWLRKKTYDDVVEINQEHIHLIRYYGMFFKKLGAKSCAPKPAELPSVPLPFEAPARFFIVFPSASMDVKKWPAERYAWIAEKIYEKTRMPLVVCGTSSDRAAIGEFLSKLSGVEVIDYTGRTDILQFIELIGRASLVVSNDTSAYHIAVAKQVPAAMVCGGYAYHRYARYRYGEHGYKDPVLICRKMECFDCNNRCRYKGFKCFPCLEQIDRHYAWEAISRLIEDEAL